MFIDKYGEIKVSPYIHFLTVFLDMSNGLLYVIVKSSLINLQSFFLYSLSGTSTE